MFVEKVCIYNSGLWDRRAWLVGKRPRAPPAADTARRAFAQRSKKSSGRIARRFFRAPQEVRSD